MASQKELVDASSLAKALLEYALIPASPELKQKCTPHYLDELQFLKLFSVDYVLGMKAVAQPAFTSVRTHYNQGIERICVGKESPFAHSRVVARFAEYSEACNSNTLAALNLNLGMSKLELASVTVEIRPRSLRGFERNGDVSPRAA